MCWAGATQQIRPDLLTPDSEFGKAMEWIGDGACRHGPQAAQTLPVTAFDWSWPPVSVLFVVLLSSKLGGRPVLVCCCDLFCCYSFCCLPVNDDGADDLVATSSDSGGAVYILFLDNMGSLTSYTRLLASTGQW